MSANVSESPHLLFGMAGTTLDLESGFTNTFCLAEMQRLNFLFLVNGTGLGNASRCAAIIDSLLEKKHRVDVLTSGNALKYFQATRPKIESLDSLLPLRYTSNEPRLTLKGLVSTIPKNISNYYFNLRKVHTLLKSGTFDAIVIDSDYTMAAFRREVKIPIIAINGSHQLFENVRTALSTPRGCWPQLIIEGFDFLFHRLVPNMVLNPTYRDLRRSDRIQDIPVVTRKTSQTYYQETSLTHKRRIALLCGGSELGLKQFDLSAIAHMRSLQFEVVGRTGIDTKNIRFHGFQTDPLRILRACDVIISNAGLSSLSEIMALKKPSIVIPISGHAEQAFNAVEFERLGLGLVATEKSLPNKLAELVREYPQRLMRVQNLNFCSSGAELAAHYIEKTASTHLTN